MFARHPETVKSLQISLRLKTHRDAEALIEVDEVKEAFRLYMNRCLVATSMTKELPNWKDVDDYLQNLRTSSAVRNKAKTLREAVEEECKSAPYELLPHVSMFALRMMSFLITARGEVYDINLDAEIAKSPEDVQFDRCIRIMHLLGFLVNHDREMRRAREAEKTRQAIGDNWI
ncbi:hypothetical protein F4813DRAFT_247310 [Daldinia decipiens]|uniref:uncharacterized protein n=1 Tax=Daldinia decipiens TaxID=326647 RepID=UPI0020C340F9|nr:uncharacterized protein F4813DRAFT_247310 [Daldinia decipiens]KAI1653661.1 hypothetical protein F4813DRAFT_247310 [Daldinia decipiens]